MCSRHRMRLCNRRKMMLMPLSANKLRNEHLTPPALVYVRQSALIQVRDNTASTTRQYDLATRAQDLTRPATQVKVIDQEHGRPGHAHSARHDVDYLIADVGMRRAGA